MVICRGISTEWLVIHCFQAELEFRNVFFLWREENRRTQQNPSVAGTRTNNKLKPGGGGGGHLEKFYTGRLCPAVQPLTLLYCIFERKRTRFVYLPKKIVFLSYTYGATFTKRFTWKTPQSTWMNQPLGASF